MKKIMKPQTSVILTSGVIILLAALGILIKPNVHAQRQLPKPTFAPMGAVAPAMKPSADRQIAILDLVIYSAEGGKIEKVDLARARIINSFAPNVFDVNGPWRVELIGKDRQQFYTMDPRLVHILDDNLEIPHSSILQTGEVAWQLVVPLYYQDTVLWIETINIYDENQNLIFSTPVDREAWLKASGQ